MVFSGRLERSSVVGHSWGITCSRAARDDVVSDLDFRLTPNCCKSTCTRLYLAQVSNPIIENRFSQFKKNSGLVGDTVRPVRRAVCTRLRPERPDRLTRILNSSRGFVLIWFAGTDGLSLLRLPDWCSIDMDMDMDMDDVRTKRCVDQILWLRNLQGSRFFWF